jgi:hypothetical protein
MSDQSQGEGWWQASDGKWYPPEQAAPGFAAPTGEVPATAPVEPVPPTQPFGPSSGYPFGPPPTPPIVPAGTAPASSPPPASPSGLGRGPLIAIVAAVVVIAGLAAFLLTRDSGSKKNASSTTNSSSTSGSSRSSSSNRSSSSADVPSGFKQLRDDTDGVSISVPQDFVTIDASDLTDPSNESSLSDLNPDIAPFLQAGNAFVGNTVISAVSSKGGGQAIIVAQVPGGGIDPTQSAFADALESQLEATGLASGVTTDTVDLPAGQALRVALTLSLNAPNSSNIDVNETLFFVQVGHTTWGIVGVSLGDAGDLFDQIANTFTVAS